jgi:transposase
MPRPFASVVELAADLRSHLEALVRARSTPQALVFRCRIVLHAARADNPSNQDIAAELDCDRHTVGQWRERFVANGLEGLQDAPRSGRPRSFSPRRTARRDRHRQQHDPEPRPARQRLDAR